jgi:hypothetical protein
MWKQAVVIYFQEISENSRVENFIFYCKYQVAQEYFSMKIKSFSNKNSNI